MSKKDLFIRKLNELKNTPQRLDYHPERDVYSHTCLVLGQIIDNNIISLSIEDLQILKYTALFHDFGKPETLKFKDDGTPTAYGHDSASVKYVKLFSHIKDSLFIQRVENTVSEHMRIAKFHEMRPFKQESLKNKLGDDFNLLKLFSTFDDMVQLFNTKSNEKINELYRLGDEYIKEYITLF